MYELDAMSIPKSSPALRPSRARAPEPSAALVALQERGLELPVNRMASVSPQSEPAYNCSLRVSPLSILSTPSNVDKPLPLEPGDSWRRRPSSTGSADIRNILNLYSNQSEHSLKSGYEEMIPYPDDSGDDDPPPPHNVHQPKAYRDTIAPLLEHQFSTDRLVVPPMPSPMSIASLPRLHNPTTHDSVPSLQLTLDLSPDLAPTASKQAGLSQTSIQITPEMTPPLPPFDSSQPPSFQQYSASLRERKIALAVPDVREADSWYDQPLSPVSPEKPGDHLRDSELSAVSPYGTEGHQRQLAFESLAPPTAQISPNIRPVSYVEEYLPEPISATLTRMVDSQMVPPPLDLTRSTSSAVSKISEGSAPVYQPEISNDYFGKEPKSQHASLMVDEPTEGPIRPYLMPSSLEKSSDVSSNVPTGKPDLEEIYRPGSAFSDGSSDPPNPETIGGQLKAMFKFGKKKDKSSKEAASKEKKTEPGYLATNTSSTGYEDDLESYKYPYWKSRRSVLRDSIEHPHRTQSPDVNSIQSSQSHVQGMRRLSLISGPGPSISSSPQPPATPSDPNTISKAALRPSIKRREPQPAIPLTNYQKYGAEIWNEKDKKRRHKEAEKAARQAEKVAAKEAKAGIMQDPPMTPDSQLNAFLDYRVSGSDIDYPQPADQRHSQPASSRAYSQTKPTSGNTDGSRPSTDAVSMTSSGKSGYNNDLFEASGGVKKKNRFASRLMMSSEQKRKLKVKESITVVGGRRLGDVDVAGLGGRMGEGGTGSW